MALPTAPCTRCRKTVVYGERSCRACGEPFNYGPTAPAVPTQAQISEALSEAQGGFEGPHTYPGSARQQVAYAATQGQPPASAVAPPNAPPVSQPAPVAPAVLDNTRVADPMIDTGRAETLGDVATEAVPGFIDSRLFGAMVPENVPVETMPGIERTQAAEVPTSVTAPDPTMAAFLDTGRFEDTTAAAPTTAEAIPGFIDSRLFGAMVPENVPVQAMPGVERQANSATRGAAPKEQTSGGAMVNCLECGALRPANVSACPECGGTRIRS